MHHLYCLLAESTYLSGRMLSNQVYSETKKIESLEVVYLFASNVFCAFSLGFSAQRKTFNRRREQQSQKLHHILYEFLHQAGARRVSDTRNSRTNHNREEMQGHDTLMARTERSRLQRVRERGKKQTEKEKETEKEL